MIQQQRDQFSPRVMSVLAIPNIFHPISSPDKRPLPSTACDLPFPLASPISLLRRHELSQLRIIINLILHQRARRLDLPIHALISHQLRQRLDGPLLPVDVVKILPPVSSHSQSPSPILLHCHFIIIIIRNPFSPNARETLEKKRREKKVKEKREREEEKLTHPSPQPAHKATSPSPSPPHPSPQTRSQA